jgi:hypothetical protein
MIGKDLIGKRIKLITMFDDPHPIESGTMGTISHIGGDVMNVNWDNGRRLGVVIGVDKYEILDDDELPPNNELIFSGNI